MGDLCNVLDKREKETTKKIRSTTPTPAVTWLGLAVTTVSQTLSATLPKAEK